MKVAAGAPKWRAWRRTGRTAGVSAPGRTIARAVTFALIALAVAVIGCAAIGLYATQHDDSRRDSEQRAALQAALGELHPLLGAAERFDPGELRLIERRAGLADLHFDTDLSADSGRAVQSVQDAQGRIVGWFNWAPDRALIHTMDQLWDIAGAVGVALAICTALTWRATRRLSASLVRRNATINTLSTQDMVTGLPNRRVMLERLEDALATRGSNIVSFSIIDIDSANEINDTLGPAGSDAILVRIAERFHSSLPAGAQLGRFGDDEFAIIVTTDDLQTAAALGDKLAASLATPIYMDQLWQISASIGIAQAPEDGTTGDELFRRASFALRAAKRSGGGAVRHFVSQIHEEHAERRFVLRELETAIQNDSFDVHYQPVVAAEGGGMVGVEALLRWTHPIRGVIGPSTFIPLAEESGLMNRLGEIVLRRALKEGARWPDLFVSVNLSPVQMRSPGLVDLLGTILAETGMTASRVTLEVTEGVLIDNPDEALTRLDALRALGVSTALDDFGSGYSSLNYLQKFPFDRLKIDRAFVASLGTTAHTGAIIQSVVTLGHALGMKVLAEGVETNEQRVLLRLAGCDEMQGYLFAKACPADAIDKILARPSAARSAARQASIS